MYRESLALRHLSNAASVFGLLLVALCLSSKAAVAAPQGPWILPAASFPTATNADSGGSPQVAVGADGSTTVVRTYFDGDSSQTHVQAMTRRAGGTFGAPVTVSNHGIRYRDPQVAIGPDGTTTVVWRRDGDQNDLDPDVIQAATRPPGGSFGSVVDLSDDDEAIKNPQIAIGANGTTAVTWERKSGAVRVQATVRPKGGSFSAPENISSGSTAERSQVAVGPDGTVTAVWDRTVDGVRRIQSATRLPSGSFGPPVEISAAGLDAYEPQIAFSPGGSATALWSGEAAAFAPRVIHAATRAAGGSFSGGEGISPSGRKAESPSLAIGADGTAVAVWQRNDGSHEIVQAAIRHPDGAFAEAVDLSAAGDYNRGPQVAIGPDGTATAVWYRGWNDNNTAQTATRPPGGTFGPVVDLSGSGQGIDGPQVAIGPDNRATAVWYRGNAFEDGVIQAASTKARPTPKVICPAKKLKSGKLKLNRKKGTAKLAVKAGGKGKVVLKGSKLNKGTSVKVGKNGKGKLTVKAKGKAARKLKKKGKVKLKLKLTYKPGGKCPSKTVTKKVKLVKKRR